MFLRVLESSASCDSIWMNTPIQWLFCVLFYTQGLFTFFHICKCMILQVIYWLQPDRICTFILMPVIAFLLGFQVFYFYTVVNEILENCIAQFWRWCRFAYAHFKLLACRYKFCQSYILCSRMFWNWSRNTQTKKLFRYVCWSSLS